MDQNTNSKLITSFLPHGTGVPIIKLLKEETGICTYLHYDKETGRLSEGKFNAEEEIRKTH